MFTWADYAGLQTYLLTYILVYYYQYSFISYSNILISKQINFFAPAPGGVNRFRPY